MKNLILITGAAGMVGSNLINKYIKKDVIIIAIDNLNLGKLRNIEKFLKRKNFYFYQLDLSKDLKKKEIFKILKKNKLQEVWLLAANSDIQKGIQDKSIDLKNTYLTTFKTLNSIKKFITKKTKIIFSSSSAIYGNVKGKISERTNVKVPISNYGLMKLNSEIFISFFSKLNDFKAYIFRFPNVVGKNLTHGILYDFKKKIKKKNNKLQILGNGEQQKPYSDVNEIINCMIYIKKMFFIENVNYFNIGINDKGLKVKEITNMFIKEFKSNKLPVYEKKKVGWKGDVIKYRYSTKKIEKLGFKFKLSSKQAVKLTIKNLAK